MADYTINKIKFGDNTFNFEKDVFIAVYNTTTLEELQDAFNNDKMMLCKNGSDIYTLSASNGYDYFNFVKMDSRIEYHVAYDEGSWGTFNRECASSSHTHGNITNGGDITATAPTIASGDQLIINDNSASKITNGPTFDGSTTTTALTPKGTWETFSKTDTNTTYTLSGALSSHTFTSTITAGGSGSGTSTSDITLAAGTGITLVDNTSTRTITISSSGGGDAGIDSSYDSTTSTVTLTVGPLGDADSTEY